MTLEKEEKQSLLTKNTKTSKAATSSSTEIQIIDDDEIPPFHVRLSRLLAETSFGMYVLHSFVKTVVSYSFTRLVLEYILDYRVLTLLNTPTFGICSWARLYKKDTTEVFFPPGPKKSPYSAGTQFVGNEESYTGYGVPQNPYKLATEDTTDFKLHDPNFRFPSAGLLLGGCLFMIFGTVVITLGVVWLLRKIPGVKAFI